MENVNPTRAVSEAAERLAQRLQENVSEETVQQQTADNNQQDVQNEVTDNVAAEVEQSQEPQEAPVKQEQEVAKKRGRKPKGQVTDLESAPVQSQDKKTPEMSVVKDSDGEGSRELDDDMKQFISYLNDDENESSDETGIITDDPKSQEFYKKYEELESKVNDYEKILNDPLVSAFAEFIKSGNTDVNEFAKQVGSLNVGEMDIESMYRMRAQEMGFDGEELEDAVMEQLDKFNTMTRLERKDEESKLRSVYKSQSAERLKSFTERIANERTQEQQRVAKIVESAETELEEVLNKMNGQRWKSLTIDESMIKTIRDAIPAFAPIMGKFDEGQKLVGFDVKDGIEMAIWKLYGKQLLKSTFDVGRTSGFEEAMKDRVRPTATPGGSTAPAYPSKSADESISDARKAAAQRASSKRSLFDVLK